MRTMIGLFLLLWAVDYGARAQTPDGQRYDCFIGASRVFADRAITSQPSVCHPLRPSAGWEEVAFSSALMVSYETASLRRAADAVDVRLAFLFDEQIGGPGGSFSYDQVTASYHFDCQGKTQRMSGAVYRLDGKQMWEEKGGDAEPVKPGTVTETALNKLCFAADQRAADKAAAGDYYDEDFICPEYRAQVDEKKQDLQDFFKRMMARNASITIAEVTQARYGNLVAHHCQKTLNYMASHRN